MASRLLLLLFLVSVLSLTSGQTVSIANTSAESSIEDIYMRFPYNLEGNGTTPTMFVGKHQHQIELAKYFNLTELDMVMEDFAINYKETVKLWPFLSKSTRVHMPQYAKTKTNNRVIYAVQISRDVQEKRKPLKPMFKFIANIHGTDMVGYALMVALMQYLVYSDGHDHRVTKLLDDIDIWIIPTMNPDGLIRTLRFSDGEKENQPDFFGNVNTQGVDLDGDFPSKQYETWTPQYETRQMLDLMKKHPFVLSGNIQGGDMVVSYPLDYSSDKNVGELSLTDDNDVFVDLAKKYAFYNPRMGLGNGCCPKFHPNGITNGNYWRQKHGSMQDANYILTNCFEVTMYVSCSKYPHESLLPLYWNSNLESMLRFIASTRQGVYGFVKDKEDKPITNAIVTVRGRAKKVRVTADGEYWRLLVWGAYEIIASAPGYKEDSTEVLLFKEKSYVQFDFTLTRQGIYGVVKDTNGKSIKGAVITTTRKGLGIRKIKTDGNGQFKCTVDLHNATVTATAEGYGKDTRVVHVTEKNPYVLQDFVLKKKLFF